MDRVLLITKPIPETGGCPQAWGWLCVVHETPGIRTGHSSCLFSMPFLVLLGRMDCVLSTHNFLLNDTNEMQVGFGLVQEHPPFSS